VKTLVVTADDFGLSLEVNEAVEAAHSGGILTAASLMVGAPAWQDAVARARRLPTLGVGLHLTLINGRPVLAPELIPGLVGRDGRFATDPVGFGARLFFSQQLRREADAEIAAQFDRFRQTGLVMDHINGHQHFHLHPVVASGLVRHAAAFGRPPVRIPVEPDLAGSHRSMLRALIRQGYALAARRLRRSAVASGLATNDHVFGLFDSGHMTEARMLAILDGLPDGLTEIYLHPATRRWAGADNLPADYRPIEELAALISPAVKAKVAAVGCVLATFGQAARTGAQPL
jgi:chitin disaccharide deacetylase